MERLVYLRDKIQELSKFHQLEIFRIFKTQDINFTENRNGIFVNMNDLNEVTLHTIKEYLDYVTTQQHHLDSIEKQKEIYKQSFFKNNKEIAGL